MVALFFTTVFFFFSFFFCCFLPRSIFSSRNFLQFAILPRTPAAGRSGFAAGMTNSNNNILSRQMSVKKVSENIRWNSSDYSCSLIHSLIRQWPTCSACSGTHRVSVIVKSIIFQRSEARRLEMYRQNNDLPNQVTSVWDCVSTFPVLNHFVFLSKWPRRFNIWIARTTGYFKRRTGTIAIVIFAATLNCHSGHFQLCLCWQNQPVC